MYGRAICVVGLWLAAGCAGAESQNPRPQGSPDMVLLSVSGHAGVVSALNCDSLDNRSYLGDPGEAVAALADTFNGLGLSGVIANFADRLDGPDVNGDGIIDDPDQRGFLQLLELMQSVHDSWIAGFDNPTRVVIVAHSHGAVWAHMAVSLMRHVPVDYLITLDGVCDLWECEHGIAVADWMATQPGLFAWDFSRPCGRWPIPGQPDDFDTQDVVFDNVRVNLEVRSDDLIVRDGAENHRLDGSQTNVLIFVADGESHNDVRLQGSDALAWVSDRISAFELAGLP
ncbi:MAG: hypothetical protein ACYTEZ_04880 [Planctomycetota bacterium]|jgi:hypothetical protein